MIFFRGRLMEWWKAFHKKIEKKISKNKPVPVFAVREFFLKIATSERKKLVKVIYEQRSIYRYYLPNLELDCNLDFTIFFV